MYEVLPRGETDATLVSQDFLTLVMNNRGITDEQRLEALSQYPDMILMQYRTVMNENYPASADEYKEGFVPMTVRGTESGGAAATVTQDPFLPAYVRVQIKSAAGTEEFSISRHAMSLFQANPELMQKPDELLEALRQYPFRLPEEARMRYNRMSRAELFDLAEQTPLLSRQEFVHSYVEFKKDAEEAGRTNLVRKIPWKQAASERAQESVGLRGALASTPPGAAGLRPPALTAAPEHSSSKSTRPTPGRSTVSQRASLLLTAVVFVTIGTLIGFLASRMGSKGK
jgi:hypothetical protein